jgi:hypothetical protein
VAESTEEQLPAEVPAEDLTDELARKYDPQRLLKLISKQAGKQESLDANLRSKYESRLKVDLGHVRIITGEFAEEFNKRKNAYATTIGGTGMILMGGSPDRSMASAAGRALLGHELTHVAQAKRGIYRASRSDDQPFAMEGHEAEEGAEAEEQAIYDDETGAAVEQSPADEQMDKEKRAEEAKHMVLERVYDMLADSMRNQERRGGADPRRP